MIIWELKSCKIFCLVFRNPFIKCDTREEDFDSKSLTREYLNKILTSENTEEIISSELKRKNKVDEDNNYNIDNKIDKKDREDEDPSKKFILK